MNKPVSTLVSSLDQLVEHFGQREAAHLDGREGIRPSRQVAAGPQEQAIVDHLQNFMHWKSQCEVAAILSHLPSTATTKQAITVTLDRLSDAVLNENDCLTLIRDPNGFKFVGNLFLLTRARFADAPPLWDRAAHKMIEFVRNLPAPSGYVNIQVLEAHLFHLAGELYDDTELRAASRAKIHDTLQYQFPSGPLVYYTAPAGRENRNIWVRPAMIYTTFPGILIYRLAKATGDQALMDSAQRLAEFSLDFVTRDGKTLDGVFELWIKVLRYEVSLQHAIFFALMARETGRQDYLDAAWRLLDYFQRHEQEVVWTDTERDNRVLGLSWALCLYLWSRGHLVPPSGLGEGLLTPPPAGPKVSLPQPDQETWRSPQTARSGDLRRTSSIRLYPDLSTVRFSLPQAEGVVTLLGGQSAIGEIRAGDAAITGILPEAPEPAGAPQESYFGYFGINSYRTDWRQPEEQRTQWNEPGFVGLTGVASLASFAGPKRDDGQFQITWLVHPGGVIFVTEGRGFRRVPFLRWVFLLDGDPMACRSCGGRTSCEAVGTQSVELRGTAGSLWLDVLDSEATSVSLETPGPSREPRHRPRDRRLEFHFADPNRSFLALHVRWGESQPRFSRPAHGFAVTLGGREIVIPQSKT